MSDTKFTKGPWYVPDPDENTPLQIVSSGAKRGVTTMFDFEDIEYPEDIANAHLMAAAPEMYEMLESALDEMNMLINEVNSQRTSKITSLTESEPDYHDGQTLYEIHQLLTKARGEL